MTNSRLEPPGLPRPHVERPLLDAMLDAAVSRRVCLVVGAAGWGKTTALAAWSAGRRVAWLRTGQPPKPGTRQAEPPPPDSGRAGHVTEHDAHGLLAALTEAVAVAESGDMVIVVDDAQELEHDPAAAEFVEYLCRRGPDRLRIVLATRSEPPFSLARLRGRGEVGEIDASRLAFSPAEVESLAAATLGGADAELVRAVHAATDGWPAAVCLAIEGLGRVAAGRRAAELDAVSGPGGRLATYLAEEVLGREPDATGTLLRHMLCLGTADAPALQATGIPNPPVLLSDLGRRGLAVSTDGPHDAWRAAEPLHRCAQTTPALPYSRMVNVQRKAAANYAERGAYDLALQCLHAIEDHAAITALLAEHGMEMINAGMLDEVLTASALPPDYLDDKVRQVVGYAKHLRGLWASADAQFAAVGSDRSDPALVWRMGILAQVRGEFGEALKVYERARLDREDTADESLLLSWMGTAHRMVGHFDDAARCAARALAAARKSGDASALATAYTLLSTLAEAKGNLVDAEAYDFSALQAAEDGNDVLTISRVRLSQSARLLAHGELESALEAAQSVQATADRLGHRLTAALALTAQGLTLRMMGRLDEAEARFLASRALCQQIGTRYLAWPVCGLGGIHLLRGRLTAARAAFEEAIALTTPSGDLICLSWALSGLARVRAADDPGEAHELIHMAAALGEGVTEIEVGLVQGWVALAADDRATALEAGERAAAIARARRHMPGLIEALLLTAAACGDVETRSASLAAAARLAHEVGAPLEEAVARLAAARANGRSADADAAERSLRSHGVEASAAAGPLGAVPPAGRCRIVVRTLGRFEVWVGGRPVAPEAWQSRKARDLLKILVARRGRQVTRDELMELLWPMGDPAKAAARLSVQLSTLRAILQSETCAQGGEADALVADRETVRLDLDMADVDAESFLTAAKHALQADTAGETDALDRLLDAEAAHAGQFLEGDPYAEWAQPAREEIEASYRAIERRLVRRLRECGDVDAVIRRCLSLLSHDRYDEQVHLFLIRVLLEAGRYGEARRRYGIYAQRMREIAVEPSSWPGAVRRPRPTPEPEPEPDGNATPSTTR